MKGSSVEQYHSGSKILHWLVALIVLMMLSGSFFLDSVPKAYQGLAYTVHKSFGLTVLALMVIRVIWIVHYGKPKLPASVPHWQKMASRAVHHCFYLFLFLMPLCGWIMSVASGYTPVYFNLFTVPLWGVPVSKPLASFMSQAHTTIAWILIGLVVLHLAAAAKHYFINRDGVVNRML